MTTVLIIDDDPHIRDVFSLYLGESGYQTLTAPDGRAGLALLQSARPDVVFCDLSMPGLGGLEVLAEARRTAPRVPFVVISGTLDLALAVEALRQGAWDYLPKPFPDLGLLVPLLQRLEERALLLHEKDQHEARLEEQIQVRTAQLARQLKEKDTLIAEVHHRVKNNLQVILVLLELQRDRSSDPQVRTALDAIQNRIHALALVQEEMYDADHAALVRATPYFESLVNHLLSAHDLTAFVTLTLEVEDLVLAPDLAFTCGLILNELVAGLTQAGPPRAPWTLRLTLRSVGPGTVELVLVDSRGSWSEWVPEPYRPSLGWDLVAGLASVGGGSVAWDRSDPRCLTVRLT